MTESKVFVSTINFEFKNENGNSVSLIGQSIFFRLSTKKFSLYLINVEDVIKIPTIA